MALTVTSINNVRLALVPYPGRLDDVQIMPSSELMSSSIRLLMFIVFIYRPYS